MEVNITKCPYYIAENKCRIYDNGIRQCDKFIECLYRKWQRAEIQLAKLKDRECLYGGDNCYKSMLELITDDSEEYPMEEKIIIDGKLSCDNCLGKTRCKQQQDAKKQKIDAILSYIANEDNEKYIAELKNEIPTITRCDVILEKQLKRLEQENEEYKKQNALLLSQLIINDGEEVTVQISQSQFDEYNDLKQTIKELTQSLDDCNVQRTQLKARLKPLEDSYFNGLSSIEIAGLAKKSIRITSYNRQLETALEDIREIATDLKQTKIPYCQIEEQIQNIITEAIGG